MFWSFKWNQQIYYEYFKSPGQIRTFVAKLQWHTTTNAFHPFLDIQKPFGNKRKLDYALNYRAPTVLRHRLSYSFFFPFLLSFFLSLCHILLTTKPSNPSLHFTFPKLRTLICITTNRFSYLLMDFPFFVTINYHSVGCLLFSLVIFGVLSLCCDLKRD